MDSRSNRNALAINQDLYIDLGDIELSAIRASGPGGQHVNTASTAVVLRFDFEKSNLPIRVKAALRQFSDARISPSGVIVIKAQNHRSQIRNKEDALARLAALIRKALYKPPRRVKTKPSRSARKKRVDTKTRRGKIKSLRRPVKNDD